MLCNSKFKLDDFTTQRTLAMREETEKPYCMKFNTFWAGYDGVLPAIPATWKDLGSKPAQAKLARACLKNEIQTKGLGGVVHGGGGYLLVIKKVQGQRQPARGRAPATCVTNGTNV
jgi:hypothetical protein